MATQVQLSNSRSSLARAWRGDRTTLGRFLLDAVRPPRAPVGEDFRAEWDDPERGSIAITGVLREAPDSRVLFVMIHGLGGSVASTYLHRSAREFAILGHSTLALNLRGADRAGDDLYNVSLVGDIEVALASPRLAHYERIHLIGYSMGGYNALHYARDPQDPRVAATVAICTPIDLKVAQLHFDAPAAYVYRRHVLGGLKEIYAAIVLRERSYPTPLEQVRATRTIHAWDRLTVAPRYGYESPEQYYEAVSIRPHLTDLNLPAMLVLATHDPMIPPSTIVPHLPPGHRLDVRHALRSGHLAFESDLDLGEPAPLGLEAQLAHWCLSR